MNFVGVFNKFSRAENTAGLTETKYIFDINGLQANMINKTNDRSGLAFKLLGLDKDTDNTIVQGLSQKMEMKATVV